MPDAGLFPQTAQLQESFGKNAEAAADRSQSEDNTNKNLSSGASAQLGEDRRQKEQMKAEQLKIQQQEQAKMQLEQLKGDMRAKGHMTHIMPEVAIGLAKETNNPSFLQFVDKDVDSRVWTSMISASLKPPKTVKLREGDKTYEGSLERDPDTGEWHVNRLDKGGSAFAPPKPQSGASEDKDINKWFDDAAKAKNKIMDAFTKKGGIPKTDDLPSKIQEFFTGPDKKKGAQLAVLKQTAQQYQTARDNYNKKAKAKGLAELPEDPDLDQAVNALLTTDKEKGSEKPKGNPDDVVQVKTSKGETVSIYRKNLDEAKKRDPKIQVVGE